MVMCVEEAQSTGDPTLTLIQWTTNEVLRLVALDDPKEGMACLGCINRGRDGRGRGSGWSYSGDGCVWNIGAAAIGFVEDDFVERYDFNS